MTDATTDQREFAPVAQLRLDLGNPRLAGEVLESEADALAELVETADVDELVQAIGNSGWIDFEPLVVLRHENTVLEGNRRLAALRVLKDDELQKEYGITPPDPVHEASSPKEVRVHYVGTRSDARDFIGFKHVNGPHKWDSLAKAKFAREWLDEDQTMTLEGIARRLGDGHNTVARLVNAYTVLEQATKAGFDINRRTKANFAFSHLYTALPRPSVRQYLGLSIAPNELLAPDPISEARKPALVDFMGLLYGQGPGKPTVIGSQNPDLNRLVDVLADRTASAMIVADRDLVSAYGQVEDRGRKFTELLFSLNKAARAVSESLGDYEFDADLDDMVHGIQRTVRSVVASMEAERTEAQQSADDR